MGGWQHPREDSERFRNALKSRFKEKTRDEWTEIFSEAEACVEPVLDIAEMCENSQVLYRNMVPEVPLSLDRSRTIAQIGNPVKLSESPVEYRHTAYPVGYHTKEILGRAGYSEEEIESMSSK